MTGKKYRDLYKRKIFFKLEKKKKILKFIATSQFFKSSVRFLATLELSKVKFRFKNRCVKTNRGKFIFRKKKLSRISLKNFLNEIKGYYPSSW